MSEKVREMFSEISPKYDMMNDILSFGIHRLWRRRVVKLLQLNKKSEVIDLASGTGDLAFAMQQVAGKVIGTDFCEDMLVVARRKAKERNIDIEFKQADAMDLPFRDNQFDAATISFGIRNVDNVSKCLSEMARVVSPGGKVIVLEFGQPKGVISLFYKFYSKYIMPTLGMIFAGAGAAYTYLPETAAKFPCGDAFLQLMKETQQYSEYKSYPLNSGIAFIYVGIVGEGRNA